jgi:hypothetical protein
MLSVLEGAVSLTANAASWDEYEPAGAGVVLSLRSGQ